MELSDLEWGPSGSAKVSVIFTRKIALPAALVFPLKATEYRTSDAGADKALGILTLVEELR